MVDTEIGQFVWGEGGNYTDIHTHTHTRGSWTWCPAIRMHHRHTHTLDHHHHAVVEVLLVVAIDVVDATVACGFFAGRAGRGALDLANLSACSFSFLSASMGNGRLATIIITN